MSDKPYVITHYTIYDKTLYLQRLLYAIDSQFRSAFLSDELSYVRETLERQANAEIDNAISSLQDILETIGYFPQLREVSNSMVLWRQPAKYQKKESN